MANINVVVDKTISDGYKLKFRTPCDSTVIEGLEVKYPAKNGVGTLIKKFVFKDAHGTELSGVGNLFVSGVMIEVLLDVTHGVAYIQNADTNSYVESVKGEIQRLENAQRQFLDVAGKTLENCENAVVEKSKEYEQAMTEATERAESVKGVYVGSGDMPDGYNVQIDPNGAAVYEMDTELNEDSQNPVTNAAITEAIESLTLAHADDVQSLQNDFFRELSQYSETTDAAIEGLDTRVGNNKSDIAALDGRVGDNETAIMEMDTKFAPIGFGLGVNTYEKIVYSPEEVDTLTKTGWYGVDLMNYEGGSEGKVSAFGISFNYAVVHVVAIDAWNFYQELYIHPANTQCVNRRWYRNDTGFSPWEHTNPPMVYGTEYRTTERFNGSPVYVKLFRASAGVSAINAEIGGEAAVSQVVEIRGMYVDEAGYHDWNSYYCEGGISYNRTTDSISLGKTVPTYASGWVILKYTKV